MIYLRGIFFSWNMLPDVWKHNVPSEHKVKNEVWRLLNSKLKENYHHFESKKDIFPEFKLKKLLSMSIQSNIFFRSES